MSGETAVAAVAFTAIGWRILRRTRRRRFSSEYRAVISGPEWRRKTQQWKREAGWRCEDCRQYPTNRRDLHTHHKRGYRMLGREQRKDVAILCSRCHRKRHRRRRRR